MTAIAYLIVFLFGTALGSFVNVLAMRYRPERNVFAKESIGGRSQCDACRKKLTWGELIPLVSFLIQKGRCVKCGKKLSCRYPVTECIAGLIAAAAPFFLVESLGISHAVFAALAAPWWLYALALAWIFAFMTLFLIILIDMKHFLVPDELNAILGALGIIVVAIVWKYAALFPLFSSSFLGKFSFAFSPLESIIWSHGVGALAAGLFFALLSIASRGQGMGFGDVKLALALGLLLGWPDAVLMVLVAFLLGGAFGAYLLFAGEGTMRDRVPFAPFFALGAAATFFFGEVIVGGYFALFGL